jgi:hypothetical protein
MSSCVSNIVSGSSSSNTSTSSSSASRRSRRSNSVVGQVGDVDTISVLPDDLRRELEGICLRDRDAVLKRIKLIFTVDGELLNETIYAAIGQFLKPMQKIIMQEDQAYVSGSNCAFVDCDVAVAGFLETILQTTSTASDSKVARKKSENVARTCLDAAAVLLRYPFLLSKWPEKFLYRTEELKVKYPEFVNLAEYRISADELDTEGWLKLLKYHNYMVVASSIWKCKNRKGRVMNVVEILSAGEKMKEGDEVNFVSGGNVCGPGRRRDLIFVRVTGVLPIKRRRPDISLSIDEAGAGSFPRRNRTKRA